MLQAFHEAGQLCSACLYIQGMRPQRALHYTAYYKYLRPALQGFTNYPVAPARQFQQEQLLPHVLKFQEAVPSVLRLEYQNDL